MAGALSEYHRGVAATNRAALLEAATALFLDQGYDRTSLARVAAAAGVSKATLFKQFPTKAALFEAVVLAAGGAADGDIPDPPGDDFIAGLTEIGLAYAALLERPRIVALMRTIIAESPRFSELGERTFDFGTLVAHAAKTRALGAGTIVGSGTVSNRDADGGPGKPIADGGVGYSCIAEVRTIETIAGGKPVTPFLKAGDTVRIWAEDDRHHPIFGVIEQVVGG